MVDIWLHFRWQQQSAIKQASRPEKWNWESTPQALSTLFLYLVISAASIECPGSATLTDKTTYCTAFKLCGASQLAWNLYMQAVFCHVLGSIYWNNYQRLGHSALCCCMLIVYCLRQLTELFYIFYFPESTCQNFCMTVRPEIFLVW